MSVNGIDIFGLSWVAPRCQNSGCVAYPKRVSPGIQESRSSSFFRHVRIGRPLARRTDATACVSRDSSPMFNRPLMHARKTTVRLLNHQAGTYFAIAPFANGHRSLCSNPKVASPWPAIASAVASSCAFLASSEKDCLAFPRKERVQLEGDGCGAGCKRRQCRLDNTGQW